MSETPMTAQQEKEMSLWGHLEELRWVVVKMVIGIVIGIIICLIFNDFIIKEIILAPALATNPPMKLTTTDIFGELSFYMQVAIWGGVILSFPYTISQLWKFISPGLYTHERKHVSTISAFTVFSFLCGMAFAYFVMLPMLLDFAASFGTESVMKEIASIPDISKYLALFLMVIIISGLIFELPLVSYFLSRLGILTPPFLRHYRRHALIFMLVLAAVLSPGGNIVLQGILFVPLWVLFEISIITSVLAQRTKRLKEKA
jgi:sec-independent protein translocase protein TatC